MLTKLNWGDHFAIHMIKPLHSMPETNTMLSVNYTSVKKIKWKTMWEPDK